MQRLAKKYKFAVIATDVVIFTIREEKLQVLLIKMKKHPFEKMWALPGGLIQPNEDLDHAAERILDKCTHVKNIYLEQLYTFGRVDRDAFGRVVSVAYFALIPSEGIRLATSAEYESVDWFSANDLPVLAYDHREIVKVASERLRAKLAYTNIIYSLLPKEFTLGEMQSFYEIIFDKVLDKRNFRKKILSLNLIQKVNRKKLTGANRPAELYRFSERKPEMAEIL